VKEKDWDCDCGWIALCLEPYLRREVGAAQRAAAPSQLTKPI
jgi:hypothetical protein